MLATTPARRYQTVDDVLKDLNSLPTLIAQTQNIVKPVQTLSNPIPPTIVSPSPSQIELELEEVKTIFTKGKNPQHPQHKNISSSSQNTQQSAKNSKLDDELEEIKKKYKNNH
jgi:hypothetical protein